MTPKGYTTRQQIENYLLITIDSSFYAQIDDWIAQAEKYIDNETARNFIADSVASAKLYDGNGSSSLLIDDAVSISEVKIDDDVIPTDEYYLYPANETPKNEIFLEGSRFYRGNQNISISGKWGFSSAVPEDITFAATVIVANIINFSNQSEGEVQSMAIGRYTVSFKDKEKIDDFNKVGDILAGYKKFTF